jgi:hypothetical protein
VAGLEGTCSLSPTGDPGDPVCDPYLCSGSSFACPSTCATIADCTAGNYCDTNSQCVSKEADGTACANDSDCVSNYCVDGFCCDTPCTDSCDACNVAGVQGTCSTVGDGNPGDPACAPYLCDGIGTACPNSCGGDADCSSGNYCKSGQCAAKEINGTSCGGANECASNNCVDGFCCDSQCTASCRACNVAAVEGTCSVVAAGSAGNPSCLPYVCDGGASTCPAACADDTVCATGNYCKSGACSAKEVNGTACTAANQCSSGNCVDGYCCNASCAGECQSCNQTGIEGACTVLPFASTPGGAGCGNFLCNGSLTGCPPSCSADAGCTTGNYCKNTVCSPKEGNGTACTGGNECQSGNCIDLFCCDNSCAANCKACDVSGSEGTCSNVPAGNPGAPLCAPFLCSGGSLCPISCSTDANCSSGNFCNASNLCVAKLINGSACTTNSQCQTDFCIDGFCCDSACANDCDACDINTFEGNCLERPKGAVGDASCSPFLCDGIANTCPNSCTVNADCAGGFYCSGNACILKESNGTACSGPDTCASGNCVDGYCCATACTESCRACDVSGFFGSCAPLPLGDPGSPSCNAYLCDGIDSACRLQRGQLLQRQQPVCRQACGRRPVQRRQRLRQQFLRRRCVLQQLLPRRLSHVQRARQRRHLLVGARRRLRQPGVRPLRLRRREHRLPGHLCQRHRLRQRLDLQSAGERVRWREGERRHLPCRA